MTVSPASTACDPGSTASRWRPALNLAIEFRRPSIYDLSPASVAQFDITLALPGRAANTGSATWPVQGTDGAERGLVRLGAHLLRPDGQEVTWVYGCAALPHAILPGQSVTLDLRLPSPPTSGPYTVELDRVAEGLTWFEDLGAPLLCHASDVR